MRDLPHRLVTAQVSEQSFIEALNDGKIAFKRPLDREEFRRRPSIVMSRNMQLVVMDSEGKEREV